MIKGIFDNMFLLTGIMISESPIPSISSPLMLVSEADMVSSSRFTTSYKVGKFDPITREPLDKHHLIPNLALKEVVRAYLKKHGWAYRMSR